MGEGIKKIVKELFTGIGVIAGILGLSMLLGLPYYFTVSHTDIGGAFVLGTATLIILFMCWVLGAWLRF